MRAVLGLAADLGLDCVAEGIETVGQLHALRALGAVRGQGHLLSRALPAEGVEAWLRPASLSVPTARSGE